MKNFNSLLILTLVILSCSKSDDNGAANALGNYQNGIFILNEGNFGSDNSSLSFISSDFQTLQNNAYGNVNNIPLGSVAQSINFYEDLAFVVVNGSNKIEVFNRYTLNHVTTITNGLNNPRYLDFVNGKAYVTNWADGNITTDDFVAVINILNFTVEYSIPVAEGPEKIFAINQNLYVLHKGGYGYGNLVSVIHATTNTVTGIIAVGDIPNAAIVENGFLYVLCEGLPNWTGTETAGKLVKINLNNQTTTELVFNPTEHPTSLTIADGSLYYTLNFKVYKMNSNDTSLPSSAIINLTNTQSASYNYSYALAVKNDYVFVADAKDFNSNGWIYVYNLHGDLLHEFEVGINPNGFYFN